MIEAGTVLQNRYRIEKHIGQGGMGKVYVAIDQRFNSTVAIKETFFEDKNLRKAFEREARLLNSLKHPALPRVSDHFNEDDGQFLVMEYIAGDDLAEMMERNGAAFPLQNVLKWANQLCDALDYLHSQGIIHRDIKPQNLKLTPSGQIVLLDFGLAKGNATDAPHQTAAKSIFGYSRSYASLEQIQGTGTEPRSDLYSLSATLYHLLTGITPADALTRAMNVLNGQTDPLIAANLINNKVPGGIASVLQKTMALNANERPESSAILRRMLEDSDKHIDLSLSNSVDGKPFSTELLTQNTKLFTAANVSNLNQSQIKTKISSENVTNENPYKTKLSEANAESKITSVRSPVENTKSANQKRKIVATFGSLLLVGSVISAMYFYNPHVSQTDMNEGIANNENKSNFVITETIKEEFPKKEEKDVNSDLAKEDANAKQSGKQVITKSTETTKNIKKETRNQSGNNNSPRKPEESDDDSDDVIVKGETIETQGMIIDENGVRMKDSPVKPPIPRVPFKGLSPTQLRKLEQLKNRKHRVIIVNPPKPKPTP